MKSTLTAPPVKRCAATQATTTRAIVQDGRLDCPQGQTVRGASRIRAHSTEASDSRNCMAGRVVALGKIAL